MVEHGDITSEQADAAYDEPLELVSERLPGLQGYRYPYFTTYAIAQLEQCSARRQSRRAACRFTRRFDQRMQAHRARGGNVGRPPGNRRGYQRAPSGAGCAAAVDRRDPRDGRRRAFFARTTNSIARGRRGDSRVRRSRSTITRPRSIRGMPAVDNRRRFAGELSDGRRHAMVAEGRRPQLYGRDNAARGADDVAQHRCGEAGRPHWIGSYHRLRASHGRDVASRGKSLARARFVGRLRARSG